MTKIRVGVEINGIPFNVVGSEDEKYVKYIAYEVDRAIEDAMRRNPKLTRTEAIILTSLNFRDDLEKEKKKLEDFKISLKNDENIKKLERFEQIQKELEELKKTKKENEELIEKYKEAEAFSSNRLKTESEKYKSTYKDLKAREKELFEAKEEIDTLKNRLANQERLNFDRNKEVINLKSSIRNLKEELSKLGK